MDTAFFIKRNDMSEHFCIAINMEGSGSMPIEIKKWDAEKDLLITDPFFFSPVSIEEDDCHQFAYCIAKNKAEHDRNQKTVDDLDPFMTVHAGKAAVHRNRKQGC